MIVVVIWEYPITEIFIIGAQLEVACISNSLVL